MLNDIYEEVKNKMKKVDFSLLWENFEPFPFAIYNNTEVCLDGKIFLRTDEFVANTAINYQGRNVAIWKYMEGSDLDALTASMIHEMFHAFQMKNNESRFPNEMEALVKYQYDSGNLAWKLEESKLISKLMLDFDQTDFSKLLQIRKQRSIDYPYQYRYEAAVEQIEGTANYVELGVLKQLSREKYENRLEKAIKEITEPGNFLPIRIVSYTIGALLIMIQKTNSIKFEQGFVSEPIAMSMINGIEYPNLHLLKNKDIDNLISLFYQRTKALIELAKEENELVLNNKCRLLGVNIYNARYLDGYIVTYGILFYEIDTDQKILYGDFVVQVDKNMNIFKIYKF